MPLSVGDKLGPYEILAPLGAGGMGEVYKARDTKLDRDVAIKVLPAALAQDPERLARFEREAKVLAALNHPNIAQIYGLEQRALVMELVEGETLKGPLPIDTALAYARQITDALEAAHEKGITHRDLKPANIMITPAGVVKVLDFGLAAVAQTSVSGDGDPANSPTLTMRATQAGMILGTAAYMSPEQARGKLVDKRADIWAFGVVLYEMLTGRQLFEGETVPDILIAVCSKEPDWNRVPANVQRLLRRCLERDPKKRLHDIADAWALLDDVGAGHARPGIAHARPLPWAVAGTLAIIAIALSFLLWRATRPVERPLQPLVRLDVDLGPDVSLSAGPNAILSPDGSRLVFGSQGRLFTRRLDQAKATELPGTQGATSPFFSPDGQWVAFFSQNKLRKISVEGGAAIALCDSSASFTGGSWGEDGNIIVALSPGGPLSRISVAGGSPTPITELDRTRREATHRWPQVLPGAKAVLLVAHTSAGGGFDAANIEVMTLADRRRKTLVRGGLYPRYLPSGHLLYVNRGTLFAVPFDLDTLAVRGAPVPLLEQVAYSAQFGYAQLDFSRNGTLVYRSGEGGGLVNVQWLDGAGKLQPLLAKPGLYYSPKLSPDGRRLAIASIEGQNQDVWVYEPQRDTMTRLTFEAGGSASWPLWTPDSQYVVFQGAGGMYWTRADGAGKAQPLTQSMGIQFPGSVTADGKRLAYQELGSGTFNDLWTVPLENDSTGLRAGKPELFLQTPFDELHPSFSPDGRWLAYDSDESGTLQVYVRAFPDKGGKWQISDTGGVFPEWSRGGRELFFRSLDNQIMVAAYTVKGDSFVADKPRLWSDKTLANRAIFPTYDLAPEGKRIAALMPAQGKEDQKAQNHAIFLMNFFDELQRKVPASK